jgi:hypothetical protein
MIGHPEDHLAIEVVRSHAYLLGQPMVPRQADRESFPAYTLAPTDPDPRLARHPRRR